MLTAEDTPTHEALDRLRAQGPVVWAPDDEVWMVVGFDEADYVLKNEHLFAHPNRRDLMTEEQRVLAAETIGGERALVLLPLVQHAALHRELTQRLSRNMERYRTERIVPVVDYYVEPFISGGAGEFMTDVAWIVPPAAIASVLGVPWKDDKVLRVWKNLDETVTKTRNMFGASAADFEAARIAAADLNAELSPIVEERRRNPQDDFISQLWSILPDILSGCTAADVIAQCRQVFTGGFETTVHLLCNAGMLLFTRPDLWRRLQEDPRSVDRFIEETLRVMGVLQQRPRIAMQDIELGGQTIRAGDRVYAVLTAAGRDPRRFESPDSLDLEQRAKRHLAFGSGSRICTGAPFARTEAREVIRTLLARIDNPALDPDREPPVWKLHPTQMGSWGPLHVRFDVRA